MGVIERIGDIGYPVGLVINLGTVGPISVPLGQNIMCAIGLATHGPAMQVLPLTSSEETNRYYQGGALKDAGDMAFGQRLAAGYFIRVLGSGYASAYCYAHDGQQVVTAEDFYGDGTVGPYDLEHKFYVSDGGNAIHKGATNMTIVYTGTPGTGEVLLDTTNSTLTFHAGEGPTAQQHVTCSLKHYNLVGTFLSPNSGIIGDSAWVEVQEGTFPAHDVEEFPGDGTVGPYALRFNDCINSSENVVMVNNNRKTIVYSSGDLAAGKVYLNITTGTLTFFGGEEPSTSVAIAVNIKYHTRKIIVHDGSTAYPMRDSMPDLVAIQANLIYDNVVTFTPEATATHMMATGTYQLAGGSDGATLTTQDYADALDVLKDYEDLTDITVTTVCLTEYEVTPSTYDLIPVLAGKLNEFENDFRPCMGFIGMRPNEDTAHAIAVNSNFANRNLVVVVNPWDRAQPNRKSAVPARAAQVAQAPLGVSTARRNALMAIQGLTPDINGLALLDVYRKDTVKALHYGRLDVLVKINAGIYSFYGRDTGGDYSGEAVYSECYENVIVNYMIQVLKYITDQFLFEKNTPAERSSLMESIQKVLDRLRSEEVINAYNLSVESGRKFNRPGDVNVHLDAENVNHIKIVNVTYNNGLVGNGTTSTATSS